MYVEQLYVEDLAHLSYLVGGLETCAIIDPKRDVNSYVAAAEAQDLKITHILETHLHADFVSGHLDLAKKTGATIYAPKAGSCKFEHVAVAQDDTIEIEDMHIRVLDTPGHTPDCVCYVVTDKSRGDEPCAAFTGDTLFTGDVGRPDLFPGRGEELASKLYDSLHDRLLKLPDFCEIYPAHGAGSLCGRAMSDKRWSTIGYERRFNLALLHDSKDAFMESLLTGMPGAPDHFARCSDINRNGPALVEDLPAPRAIEPAEAQSLVGQGHVVVDTRGYPKYAGGHIAGAYNVGAATIFPTFAGWVLPPDRPLLLVTDSVDEVPALATQLRRVGLDNVVGYLAGGMEAWANASLPVAQVGVMSVQDLKAQLDSGEPVTVLDVRTQGEWDGGHIDGAVHIPFPNTRTRHGELDPGQPVAVLCRTGGRAGIGASILKQHGFENVSVVAGGMSAWQEAADDT